MENKGFTRKVSYETKWMFLLVLFPLYFYCGSLIGTALLKLFFTVFSLKVSYTTLNCLLNVIVDSGMIIIVGWVMKETMKEQWHYLKEHMSQHIFIGVIIGTIGIFIAEICGGMITMALGGADTSANQELIDSLTQSYPVAMMFTSVVLAPILEEMIFRGIVFSWVYEWNPKLAHVISGFLFGFVHIMSAVLSGNISEWVQIFSYSFMGMVLSYLYEKTNDIYVPILTHATNNFISMILLFLH